MALAASVVGSQVPLAAVTLETLGLLLEVLGEVPSETAQLLQAPLVQKLTCHSSLLRMGVGSRSLHDAMPDLIIVYLTPAAGAAHGHVTADYPAVVGMIVHVLHPKLSLKRGVAWAVGTCTKTLMQRDGLTDSAYTLRKF